MHALTGCFSVSTCSGRRIVSAMKLEIRGDRLRKHGGDGKNFGSFIETAYIVAKRILQKVNASQTLRSMKDDKEDQGKDAATPALI